MAVSEDHMCYSDDEDESGQSFVLLFGAYKQLTVGEVARCKKGRDTLRYYLTWADLRADCASAIRGVLNDYQVQKNKQQAKS